MPGLIAKNASKSGSLCEMSDTLKLAPRLAAGVPISADVAASEPAVVGALWIGTEMMLRVDGASAPSGEGE